MPPHRRRPGPPPSRTADREKKTEETPQDGTSPSPLLVASKGAADQREREEGPASPGIKNWRGRPAHGFDLPEEGTGRGGGGVWEGGRRGEGALNAALLRFTGGEGGRSKSSSERGKAQCWLAGFSLGAHVKLAAS